MKTRFVKSALAALALFGLQSVAHASLIGDTINFQCENCGPPTSDDFLVTVGGPELTLFNQFTVDVEASTLRIDWIFNSSSIISDLTFSWNDLDWLGGPGGILSASIDASSTWPDASTLTFGDDFVRLVNGNDSTVSVGDFLLINLNGEADVPEPGTLALLGLGLVGMGIRRRMKI